jgi:hypothetical protein
MGSPDISEGHFQAVSFSFFNSMEEVYIDPFAREHELAFTPEYIEHVKEMQRLLHEQKQKEMQPLLHDKEEMEGDVQNNYDICGEGADEVRSERVDEVHGDEVCGEGVDEAVCGDVSDEVRDDEATMLKKFAWGEACGDVSDEVCGEEADEATMPKKFAHAIHIPPIPLSWETPPKIPCLRSNPPSMEKRSVSESGLGASARRKLFRRPTIMDLTSDDDGDAGPASRRVAIMRSRGSRCPG